MGMGVRVGVGEGTGVGTGVAGKRDRPSSTLQPESMYGSHSPARMLWGVKSPLSASTFQMPNWIGAFARA